MDNLGSALFGISLGTAAGLFVIAFCPRLTNGIYNIFEWIQWKLIPGYTREQW
jgi:hypothetical protein